MAQRDVERYEALARHWLEEADAASEEEDRRSCLAIAQGYARLAAILGGGVVSPSGESETCRS